MNLIEAINSVNNGGLRHQRTIIVVPTIESTNLNNGSYISNTRKIEKSFHDKTVFLDVSNFVGKIVLQFSDSDNEPVDEGEWTTVIAMNEDSSTTIEKYIQLERSRDFNYVRVKILDFQQGTVNFVKTIYNIKSRE